MKRWCLFLELSLIALLLGCTNATTETTTTTVETTVETTDPPTPFALKQSEFEQLIKDAGFMVTTFELKHFQKDDDFPNEKIDLVTFSMTCWQDAGLTIMHCSREYGDANRFLEIVRQGHRYISRLIFQDSGKIRQTMHVDVIQYAPYYDYYFDSFEIALVIQRYQTMEQVDENQFRLVGSPNNLFGEIFVGNLQSIIDLNNIIPSPWTVNAVFDFAEKTKTFTTSMDNAFKIGFRDVSFELSVVIRPQETFPDAMDSFLPLSMSCDVGDDPNYLHYPCKVGQRYGLGIRGSTYYLYDLPGGDYRLDLRGLTTGVVMIYDHNLDLINLEDNTFRLDSNSKIYVRLYSKDKLDFFDFSIQSILPS
jgi:hypothetical protein